MSEENRNRGSVVLAVASWAVPLAAVLLFAIPIGLEIAQAWQPPEWIPASTAVASALLVPMCLGMSIACFALRSHVQYSRFRRHAVAGIVVGTVLVVLIVVLLLSGQKAAPFIYAL